MRRRLLVWLLVILAVLMVGIAALPWWLGWAVRMGASRYGITIAGYQRVGYARFVLRGIRVNRNNVTVTIDRAESDTPVLWWWRHVRGAPTAVAVGNWGVEVRKPAYPRSATTPTGWVPLHNRLLRIAAQLERWLPEASAGSGVVRWPGGEIRLDAARWEGKTLAADRLRYRAVTGNVTAVFSPAKDLVTATAVSPAGDVRVALESRGADIAGTLSWLDQPTTLHARYAERGWMPAEAVISGDHLNIPGGALKMGAAYGSVRGHVQIAWHTDRFNADIAAQGEPVSGKAVPPLEVTLRGAGDLRAFSVEALHVQVPGVVANLTSPVTIERNGKVRESTAQFTVEADLARQPWFPAQGTVSGRARVLPDLGRAPVIAFQLLAKEVVVAGASLRSGEVRGRFSWPELQLEEIALSGATGETIHGRLGWDFRNKEIVAGEVQGTLKRETLGRMVPAGIRFDRVTVDAHVSGAVTTLSHAGHVELAGLRLGKMNPLRATAEWTGLGAEIKSFGVTAAVGDARLSVAGTANLSGARLSELTYVDHQSSELTLTQPAHIRWRPVPTIDSLHLSGPHAAIDLGLVWAEAGEMNVAVRGVPSGWIKNFVPMPGPAWTLTSLAIVGNWNRGPMKYTAGGNVTFDFGGGRQAQIAVTARGDHGGLTVDALHAVESGNAVVNASGKFPITFSPRVSPFVSIDPSGALALEATTVPNAAFWQQLAAISGVELRSPEVTAHLTGSWAQPRGQLAFRADRAAMDPQRFQRPMPTIDALDVELVGGVEGVRLNRFSFTVEKQLVRASGTVPMGKDAWMELTHDPLSYLRGRARLRIEIPDAQVGMFSRFLPAALAPTGKLQADVQFDRGTLGGFLRLRDAASRPLGPLGVLQQISADVEFSDHRVDLRNVTATSGGQPVTLTGTVELPKGGWNTATISEPKYDIALKGENLPFVRQSGMLVRGDVDLKLLSPPSGPPHISGKVGLRESLFLTDVRAFLPSGGTASPSRRPPYFSVEISPLRTWVLDIDVAGSRFLRVRTPVFGGVVSARFHLGGTLGEPRATGEATIDQGQVLMPFASFEVKQGAVRLSEENPYEPTIYLRGTGRHYGYDLTMEVSGKASQPKIDFTSSPALDSEQVILMVMTGAAPSNEVNTTLTHRAVQIGRFFSQGIVSSFTGGGDEPDRLSIESGEKISLQGRETYAIEYKLTDRWSLTGEYDEFDEYNAGFKWRVAPRKKPR